MLANATISKGQAFSPKLLTE